MLHNMADLTKILEVWPQTDSPTAACRLPQPLHTGARPALWPVFPENEADAHAVEAAFAAVGGLKLSERGPDPSSAHSHTAKSHAIDIIVTSHDAIAILSLHCVDSTLPGAQASGSGRASGGIAMRSLSVLVMASVVNAWGPRTHPPGLLRIAPLLSWRPPLSWMACPHKRQRAPISLMTCHRVPRSVSRGRSGLKEDWQA